MFSVFRPASALLIATAISACAGERHDVAPILPRQAEEAAAQDGDEPDGPASSLTPVRSAIPALPLPGADMLVLQDALQAALDRYGVSGVYAVAVTDLQTGETVSINGAEARLSGCVMNLFVIFQAARDIEAGLLDVQAVDDLVAATTWSSNAQTARELYALVGGGDAVEGVRRVDALITRVLQLEGVLIDHPPGYHDESIGRDYNNWATAEALNQALLAFWRGEVVGERWRAWVLEHLAEVKPGLNYLTAAVPEGVVSHKNGFMPADTGYVDNDVGIVRLQRDGGEAAYAVSFFSEQVAVKYGDVVLGQQVSTLAYEVMAARYPATR